MRCLSGRHMAQRTEDALGSNDVIHGDLAKDVNKHTHAHIYTNTPHGKHTR